MNILLISTHLNAGGITSYLFTLTKELMKRGHEICVVTSGGSMEDAFIAAGASVEALNIRTKSELDPRIYLNLGRLSRIIQDNDIDVVHAHTRISQVMGRLIQKRTGIAYISTCHGFFKTRLSRRLAPCWGDKVIAISRPVADHLIKDFHIPDDNVVLIENGIDLDVFHAFDDSKKREKRKCFDLGDSPVVGNVARLSVVKGPDIMIDAMKNIVRVMPDCILLLIGQGKIKDDLKAQVDRLGLNENVRFLSIVNRTSEMLSLFDVFVMPSRQEGLGLSIMEAQAAGLPVVASRVGGIPSLIDDGHNGILVEPENSKALAESVVNLFHDKKKLKEIGNAGRASIEKNYSAAHMTDKIEDLYKQMIKK